MLQRSYFRVEHTTLTMDIYRSMALVDNFRHSQLTSHLLAITRTDNSTHSQLTSHLLVTTRRDNFKHSQLN